MAWLAIWLILIVPVSVAVGVFLLVRGVIGKVRLSEPHCAKCKYDLRAHPFWESPAGQQQKCPECGSDLSADNAVHFGRAKRRPRLIWAGVALLLVPVLLVWASIALRPRPAFVAVAAGPMGNRTKTNAQLITELPANANAPWHWQELDARLKSGSLSAGETAQAIDALIANVETTRRKQGQSGPLHWADQFLKAAQQNNQISANQLARLATAFHGPEPKLVARDRIIAGRPLTFSILWGTHWNLPDTKFVKALRELRVNQKTVKVESHYGARTDPDHLSEAGSAIWGKLPLKLAPGVYDLTFIVDAGVLDESTTFVGADNKPGQKKRWRDVKHTMEATMPLKLTVLPEGQEVVQLITDPAMDPVKLGVVKRPRLIVRRASAGSSQSPIDVIFPGGNKTDVPVIGQWFTLIDGKEQALVSYMIQGQSGGYRTQAYRKPLPPNLTEVDLVFHPRIVDAEQYPEVTQIWGRDIIFKKVPLERFDRETTQPATVP